MTITIMRVCKRSLRVSVGIAVAAALAMLLGACGSSSSSSSTSSSASSTSTSTTASGPTGTLNVQEFTSYELPMNALVKAFEKSHPGVTVHVSYFVTPPDYDNALLTALAAGGGPDLFDSLAGATFPQSLVPLIESHRLTPVTGPWIAQTEKSLLSAVTVDGDVYQWPFPIEYSGVWYNTKLLSQLGLQVPTNFSQVLADCKASAAKGLPFYAVTTGAAYNFGITQSLSAEWVQSPDPNWYSKLAAHKVTFESTPGWHTAFQRFLQMQSGGCFEPHPEAAQETAVYAQVAAGKAVGSIGTFDVLAAVKQLNPSINLVFAPLPADTASQTVFSASPEDGLSLNANSGKKELAMEFVNFLASPTGSATWASLSNTISFPNFTANNLAPYLSTVKPLVAARLVRTQPSTLIPSVNEFAAITVGLQNLSTGQTTIQKMLASVDAAGAAKK